MKKIFALSFILVLAISACLFAAETPEVNQIRWARANSGNVLVTLAKNNGYLKEYGLEIIEMPLNSATNSDRLAAVIAGEADYACLSGDLLFRVGNLKDVIEIVAWADDLMPNYGCCRMNMHSDFVKANPVTVKLLLKALIRAEQFLRANPDESVKILAKELEASEDFVAAYLKNPNYIPSVDPVKHSIKATWDIMMKTGFLAPEAKDFDLDSHINTDLYKAALDELVQERRDEDPAFYDERVEFFKANNL